MFFILGALLIISNNELSFTEKSNFGKFSGLYVGWLNKIYFNFQILTGNIIRLDWFSK